MSHSVAALIVAGGESTRFGGQVPKPYCLLAGKAVLRHTVEVFLAHPAVNRVQVVMHPEHEEHYRQALAGLELPVPVMGGKTRQESVHNGLKALLASAAGNVLIHDAARPAVSPRLIERVIVKLMEGAPAVMPVLPVLDTLRHLQAGHSSRTVDRAGIYAVQTPQGFDFQTILRLHQDAQEQYTDDIALAEMDGIAIAHVAGERMNHKITTQEDIAHMEQWIRPRETRVGQGVDVHPMCAYPHDTLKAEQVMVLCGVPVPSAYYLKGHSDADVGLHALTDALLGAVAAGDIGQHFPPSDARWQGADSQKFVEYAVEVLQQQQATIIHADITLMCEEPRIAPYREAMREAVAHMLQIDVLRVSVKATTTEGLGFAGRKEGVAAQALVTVEIPREIL